MFYQAERIFYIFFVLVQAWFNLEVGGAVENVYQYLLIHFILTCFFHL